MSDNTMNNNGSTLGRMYAAALLDMADEAGTLNEIAEELDQVGQLIETQHELRGLYSSSVLSDQQRAQSIETVFKGRVSDLIFHFLLVVSGKGRMAALPEIVRSFAKLMDERNGVIEADLFVAGRLSDEEAQSISDRVGSAVGSNVVLQQHVDPALIGGLKIRMGDEMIDGSVATQLRLIRNQLIETGREKARAEVVS